CVVGYWVHHLGRTSGIPRRPNDGRDGCALPLRCAQRLATLSRTKGDVSVAEPDFAPVTGRPLIEGRGLSVAYGRKQVLRGLDISVNAGECLSIVGRSGCGKTSLLMAIAGFIPHGGKIHAPSRLGVVFQSYAIYPWLTVSSNIAFGLDHLEKVQRD